MEAVGLDPYGCRFAFAGGTAPLARTALVVGSSEPPLAVLAGRRLVLAPLHGRGLLERDHGQYVPVRAGVVDGAAVVPLVHRRGLGVDPASVQRIEQRADGRAFVRLARLHAPRERQVGLRSRRHVQAVAVEAAALACADGGAVPPGGVGVGELLAFPSALRDVPLPVRIRGHVGGVDRHVPPEDGVALLERSDDGGDALVQQVVVLAEFRQEAVARPCVGT